MTAPIETMRLHAPSRAALDAGIRADGEVLSEVARLLDEASPLSTWPPLMAAALAGAFPPQAGSAREGDKARRLRRHLFVDLMPPAFPSGSMAPGRWSDRLRADLADMVPFGTGLHLVDALTT